MLLKNEQIELLILLAAFLSFFVLAFLYTIFTVGANYNLDEIKISIKSSNAYLYQFQALVFMFLMFFSAKIIERKRTHR